MQSQRPRHLTIPDSHVINKNTNNITVFSQNITDFLKINLRRNI